MDISFPLRAKVSVVCGSHHLPSIQNCLKFLRAKNLPDLDNRYFVKLISVISLTSVSVRNKVIGSREIIRGGPSYHAVFLLLHFLWIHQKTTGSSMQHGPHALCLAPHHSPACPLSSLPCSTQAALLSTARAETETLPVHVKSSVNKGVFHSRVERVKEVRPFWGVTLNPTC